MSRSLAVVGLVVASALFVSGVNPTNGSSGPEEVEDIRSAVDSQSVSIASSRVEPSAGVLEIGGGHVTAPTSTGTELEFALPGTPATVAEHGDLTVNVTQGDSYSTALQDGGNGTFRALIHIESREAPREFRFEMSDDVELIPLEDGGVSARDVDGNLLGTFEPAWAVDAEGNSIPTSYRIDGVTLVQSVSLPSNVAYPVVADPFWIPVLMVMARFTAHAASQAAARGVSQALIKQVVQNGVKTAGNKGTSVFTQGSGSNRIRVIVDNATGNIITVTKG